MIITELAVLVLTCFGLTYLIEHELFVSAGALVILMLIGVWQRNLRG